MLKLRDYQQEAINLLKIALKKSKKIVLVASTRTGKTVIFAYMAQKLEAANKKVLILTHREEILQQTLSKLNEFGISAGQIRSGKTITKNLITVGMIQTVHNRLKKQEKMVKKYKFKSFTIVEKPDLIIIDECHHSKAKTWEEVLRYFEDVPRIGFTASPERHDGSGLIDLFDRLVIIKSTKWMIDNHWLSRPVHLCPPSPLDKANLKLRAGDYDKQSMSEIMKKHVVCSNVVKCYREFFNGAPVIIFCCTIEHAKQMVIAYKADGWNPVIIYGKMNKADRNEALNGFKNGKYHQLISIDLIGEGIDVPTCYGVQLLRKTKSLALYLQMSSRGITPVYADGYNLEDPKQREKALIEGKPESIILDNAGNYWNHGSILKERDWTIDHKKRDNKKKVSIKKITCPKCHFDWEIETKLCPHCGFNFEIARQHKKKFEMVELKENLINVNNIEKNNAENLSKIILRIKEYKNKKSAMLAILHNSIKFGENNVKNRIAGMCTGLGYDDKYKFRVWRHLRSQYGERLDRLA